MMPIRTYSTSTMINFLLALLLLAQAGHTHDHVPEDGATYVLPELRLRAIGKKEDYTWITELLVRQGLNKQTQYHGVVGGRYRLSENIRLGLHYRGQKNQRNNENWVQDHYGWRFNEEHNDWESIVYPELSLRFLLSSRIRLELREHYEWNLLFSQQGVRHRTTLDYFFGVQSSNPKSLYFSNEIFLPTNYSRQQINEMWNYLGYRFGLTDRKSLGISIAYVEWTWRESNDFLKSFPSETYSSTDRAFFLTLHYVVGITHN